MLIKRNKAFLLLFITIILYFKYNLETREGRTPEVRRIRTDCNAAVWPQCGGKELWVVVDGRSRSALNDATPGFLSICISVIG